MKRFIYFVKPRGFAGPVKIGLTSDVKRRVTGLHCASPFPLELLATVEGDKSIERRLHALFEKDHSHAEWFFWSERLGEVIAAINAGFLDIDQLPEAKRLDNRRKARPERSRLHGLNSNSLVLPVPATGSRAAVSREPTLSALE